MKKVFMGMFAMATMLLATSCSEDELIAQSSGNEVTVSFTANVRSDVKTKAVGDDTDGIDQLIFAVYDENGDHLSALDQTITSFTEAENGKKKATINVTLVKGQTYSFAFWAQDADYAAYSFNPATKLVSVNYGQTANNKNADAFFANETLTVSGSFEKDITLKRPFAQVNFLTTGQDILDARKAGFDPKTSSIVVKNAATSLNVLDGTVTGSTEATFNLADILLSENTKIKNGTQYVGFDATTKAFSLKDTESEANEFYYLATAYFLTGAASTTIDASMNVVAEDNGKMDLSVSGVNAQRNFRTNIYGNLLTSGGKFNVTVDPGFDGDYSDKYEDPTTKVVSTIAEAAALMNPTDGSEPVTNVTITEAPTSEATLTLPDTQEEVTINFAFEEGSTPAKITIEGGSNSNANEMTVNGDAGELVINAPQSTVTLNGNYTSVIATTAENTLIVPKGVTIGDLTLEKGNAEIYYGAVTGTIVKATGCEITWLVDTKEQLVTIATRVNDGTTKENIKLVSDIDLNNENWMPIGTKEHPFTGTLDGNEQTIKNLKIVEDQAKDGKAYIGFFGYANNVTIKDVIFENVNINIPCLDIDHSQGHIGAVAGSLEGTSTIENVTVKGDIKVEATFEANGASRVAVVAGGNSYGDVTMKNVHVKANEGSYLKANNNTGALAGQLQGKNVFENCSSNIDVTVKKFFAGGLIGLAAGDSKFDNCHTTGDVTVTAGREGRANDHYRVGGIAGGWADGKTNVCILTNCSYTGKVSGTNADGSVANPLDYAGYVGRGYTLNGCAGSKVIIDGDEYVQATDNIHGFYIVNGVYEIGSAASLVYMSDLKLKGGESVKLIADIDLVGIDFKGLTAFNSEKNNTFDGQGHTVSNWNYEGKAADMGFIRNWVGPIKNVKFENCHLKTAGRSAVVAAKVYGNIENITVNNCSIEDSYWACGIVAGLYNAGSISNCTVTNSSIKSNGGTGGIVGVINETAGERKLTNCSVSNSTIENTGAYGEAYTGGGLIGMFNVDKATYKIEKCTVSDNTLKGGYIYEKYPANENVTEVE